MKRRRRDNEASSSASISEEVETVDDIDSNSPMVYEEDGNVAITEEQLVDQLERTAPTGSQFRGAYIVTISKSSFDRLLQIYS